MADTVPHQSEKTSQYAAIIGYNSALGSLNKHVALQTKRSAGIPLPPADQSVMEVDSGCADLVVHGSGKEVAVVTASPDSNVFAEDLKRTQADFRCGADT